MIFLLPQNKLLDQRGIFVVGRDRVFSLNDPVDQLKSASAHAQNSSTQRRRLGSSTLATNEGGRPSAVAKVAWVTPLSSRRDQGVNKDFVISIE